MNSALTHAAAVPFTRRTDATKVLRTCAVTALLMVAPAGAFAADVAGDCLTDEAISLTATGTRFGISSCPLEVLESVGRAYEVCAELMMTGCSRTEEPPEECPVEVEDA